MLSSANHKRKIIVWGGTGHCRVLAELFECHDETISAVVDNRKIESPLQGVPMLHGLSGLNKWLMDNAADDVSYFAIAIGGDKGRDRLEILAALKSERMRPLTLIHPAAYCARNARIGEASQILANATISTNVNVGAASIINTAASVDHDVRIGAGVHIGPGACLAGEIVVDDHAFIGTGAVILPRIHIGKGSVIGAGAVVTKDVRENTIVVGNPARLHTKQTSKEIKE